MATLTIKIISCHENGHSQTSLLGVDFTNVILDDFLSNSEINWATLNSKLTELPEYLQKVKEQMRIDKIEVPDSNYWTTEGVVIGLNSVVMNDDYDWYEIEDKLYTGDFID